ncbi:MAG: AAA family ATPase [Acidobacteria bacterium]|nr:AAA family ATPase [Acidobacteriota bacterium]
MDEKSRLVELIEYAKQTALMGYSAKPTVESYGTFHAYEDELTCLPGITLNLSNTNATDDETDEVWLTISRLRETPPPEVSSPMLKVWIDLRNDPAKRPTLRPHVPARDIAFSKDGAPSNDSTEETYLESLPSKKELKQVFEEYVAGPWSKWAGHEKTVRQTIKIYGDLFTLKQQLEGGIIDAPLELVWGIGVAVWRIGDNSIRLPLITKGVELSLNERSMAIEIRPREGDPRVELQVFSDAGNPEVPAVKRAAEEFFGNASETISPFEKSTFEGLIRSAVALLDSNGTYWPEQNPDPNNRQIPPSGDNLIVTDSWVLFARPRGANIFIEDLERFQQKLKSPEDIDLPNAVSAVVTEPSNEGQEPQLPSFRGLSMVGGTNNGSMPKDLFFPMAFNDEQVKIVQLLEVSDGVVVQGPPGTGKTHTIANIICHYLAEGKRVLVTSMREPALTVLQEKLPNDIRPLAVSLLTNESKGMKQFQFAIERIAGIAQSENADELRRAIQSEEKIIDQCHAAIALCDRKIADWANMNLKNIDLDGEHIEPRIAANEVITSPDIPEWFDDVIEIGPEYKPQFSDVEIQNLRVARTQLGEDLDYLNCRLPDPDSMPEASEILEVHRTLRQVHEIQRQVNSGEIPDLADSSEDTIRSAQVTLSKIETLTGLRREIDSANLAWSSDLIKLIRSGKFADSLSILENVGAEIESALNSGRKFLEKPIALPDDFAENAELIHAVVNLAKGNRPFGMLGIFGKAEEKKQLAAVKIVNSSPSEQSEWEFVRDFLDYKERLIRLIVRWNVVSAKIGMPVYDQTPSSASSAKESFDHYKTIVKAVQLEHILADDLKTIFPTWQEASLISSNETTTNHAARIIQSHLDRFRLAQVWVTKERFSRLLDGTKGRIVDRLRVFLNESLGNGELTDEQFQLGWSELFSELRRVSTLSPSLDYVVRASELIENSGAVNWAKRIKTEPVIGITDALLPNNWQQIWRVKRLTTFLKKADGRQELKELERKRLEAEKRLATAYRNTIKYRTFLKLKENATPLIRGALEAFRTAIGKIGRGTGRRAVRYRRDARNAASQANFAIPCWIMPHYRVSESLPSDLGSFDLVIIDEASQSDLTALPALLRAKKVLVVGDEKQVSPEGIGLAEERIQRLMDLHLRNQIEIFRSQMTPERSIYDLFKVVFAGSGVMLKEHFRCVPAIIEYSRREFYNHEIVPLRIPKSSERIDPPLVDVLVEDGVRKRDENIAEATFIVEEIKKIINDPELAGRSIGVVSLLGNHQARLIYEKLKQEVGFETLGKHNIACGDPRTFQGNERDIMFLSMVASRGDASPLSRDTFAQRFNVAGSRARDRMYLVRSVEISDLSKKDEFRIALIQHFATPYAQDEQLTQSARELCESQFECDIYDVLTTRGFKVTPQVPVGGFRIDMVVEGDDDSRLAIECDGDRYHGPERWDDDMRRQRILERAGWHFWRCFASQFALHRDEVIADLLSTLEERGISPSNTARNQSRYVENRRFRSLELEKASHESQLDPVSDTPRLFDGLWD